MFPRALLVCLLLAGCAAHPPARQGSPIPAATATAQRVDFARDVRPLLESRCRPCHFEGGRMYDRLPFDRPDTIRQLGTRLFTRIKAEDERAMIRRFLAEGP